MSVKKIFIVSSVILCLASATSCDTINKVIEDNAVTINPEPEKTTRLNSDGSLCITESDTDTK